MTYRADILATTGLMGYWPLNESGGTTATDLTGNKNGTITGATPGATGIVTNTGDTCFSFDGSGDIVTIGADADFNNAAFCIEMWFSKTGSWGEDTLACMEVASGGARGWALTAHGGDTGKLLLDQELGEGFIRLASTGWDLNTVWHIVAGFGGGKQQFYRNGVQVDLGPGPYGTFPVYPTNVALTIGGKPSGNPHVGSIADVSLYNVMLDAETIAAHYAAGIAEAPSSGPSRITTQFQLRPY